MFKGFKEFKCELFEVDEQGGDNKSIIGGGLISADRWECERYAFKSIGKMVRKWDGKETTTKCVGYKIWQRIN